MWSLETLKRLNEAREKFLRKESQEEAQEARAEEAARQHQIKADLMLDPA